MEKAHTNNAPPRRSSYHAQAHWGEGVEDNHEWTPMDTSEGHLRMLHLFFEFCADLVPKMRMRLDHAYNVRQVFNSLALAT